MRVGLVILDFTAESKWILYYNACVNSTAWFKRQNPSLTIKTTSKREHKILELRLEVETLTVLEYSYFSSTTVVHQSSKMSVDIRQGPADNNVANSRTGQ